MTVEILATVKIGISNIIESQTLSSSCLVSFFRIKLTIFLICCDHVLFDSNTFNTENMAVPHRAVLPILMRDGILLTRLVVGTGVHITEVVSGGNRLTIHVNVYASVLVVGTMRYPTLLVVHLSM